MQMMEKKTLFERLPKRDRDEVLRMAALYSSWASSPEEYALIQLRRLREHREKLQTRTSCSLLAGSLHGLSFYFCNRGIIRRFLDNDVAQLRLGVDTAARLGFLFQTAGGTDYSSYDCSHIFEMLLAMAVEDHPLVAAFLNQFPGPFRSGHPATVLLTNGLYAVLREDRIAFATLENRIREQSERNFFRAMFDCLLGIMSDDASIVAASIGTMVKWNRRQGQLNSSMRKLICLNAHAFYNLCRRVFIARDITVPLIPNESTWDSEFQELLQSTQVGPVFFDFSPVNRLLGRWMQELPAKVALEDLVAHYS